MEPYAETASDFMHGLLELVEIDDSKTEFVNIGEFLSQSDSFIISSFSLLSDLFKDSHLDVKYSFVRNIAMVVDVHP